MRTSNSIGRGPIDGPGESSDIDPFLWGPDSEMWRINRDRCGLLFGPAAAILQVAHPRIAQGVFDHSDFRTDAMGRLRRTLQATNRIAFGRVSEAETVRARMARVHGAVKGNVAPGIPGPPKYSAFEPELLVWVLATLVVAAIHGHEFIHGTLARPRKDSFYRDMLGLGGYFGLDPLQAPRDWGEFESYYNEMIDGDLLGSHPLCGELARGVIYPRDSLAVRCLGHVLDFIPLETLPPRLRDRLGLVSTGFTRIRMRLIRRFLPRLFLHLPPICKFYPEYRQAVQRRGNCHCLH